MSAPSGSPKSTQTPSGSALAFTVHFTPTVSPTLGTYSVIGDWLPTFGVLNAELIASFWGATIRARLLIRHLSLSHHLVPPSTASVLQPGQRGVPNLQGKHIDLSPLALLRLRPEVCRAAPRRPCNSRGGLCGN